MTGLIRQDSNILPSLEHLHICLYHGDMRAISSDRAQFILAISNDALRTTFRAIESRQVNPRYGKACIVYSKSRQLYKWLPVAMMLTKNETANRAVICVADKTTTVGHTGSNASGE